MLFLICASYCTLSSFKVRSLRFTGINTEMNAKPTYGYFIPQAGFWRYYLPKARLYRVFVLPSVRTRAAYHHVIHFLLLPDRLFSKGMAKLKGLIHRSVVLDFLKCTTILWEMSVRLHEATSMRGIFMALPFQLDSSAVIKLSAVPFTRNSSIDFPYAIREASLT